MVEKRTSTDSLADIVSILVNQVQRMSENLEQSQVQLTSRIDSLAIEVGELRASIQDQKKSIDGLIEESREQHKVAQAQSANVAQLIALAQQQQATVDRLLAKN